MAKESILFQTHIDPPQTLPHFVNEKKNQLNIMFYKTVIDLIFCLLFFGQFILNTMVKLAGKNIFINGCTTIF